MNKEQIKEVIENELMRPYADAELAIKEASYTIAAEFEKKEKERIEFAKFSLWYYNEILHSNSVSWEEVYELFKKDKAPQS